MVNSFRLLSNGCSVTYLFKNGVDDNINISGFNMHNDFKNYKLDKTNIFNIIWRMTQGFALILILQCKQIKQHSFKSFS